jgi:aminotransferase in exopolysaccharide biosynthesis
MENKRIIPLSVPNLKGRELELVTEAVKTEWVSSGGPFVNEFEKKLSSYVKSKGAVACQNGTAGIHIALEVCNISPLDEIFVPSLTFIAAVNPVKYVGANPIFMDCDDTLTIDAEKLLRFCQVECSFIDGQLQNLKSGKKITAIIVVHVFGNIANMEKIMSIAGKYNLKVVEDATEALGSFFTRGIYAGRYAGTIGDVGVFSFNGNKIITTGGGGMIVSNNEEILKKSKHLTTQAKSDELYYKHDKVGYNYRMTNLQAALGIAQLEQLEEFIEIKRANYIIYKKSLEEIEGLSLMSFREDIRPNYWFYSLLCDTDYNLNRDEILTYLSNRDIQSRPIWDLINKQLPYQDCEAYNIVTANYYLERILNIPCSSNLSKDDILFVVLCLENFVINRTSVLKEDD